MSKLTPMMQQYQDIKDKYQDAILFFRMGDFYEMFNEDAKIAARQLDLTLTARNKGSEDKTPMAGIPYHAADSYIATLINKGYKVAICEQIEDPAEAQGIVARDVIRVITPGTVIENEMLNDKENNYLACVANYNEFIGFAYIDISTGEFLVTEIPLKRESKLWDEFARIEPKEIIIASNFKDKQSFNYLSKTKQFIINECQITKLDKAYQLLTKHLKTNSLIGFGIEDKPAVILAASEIILFLQETQKRSLTHINKIVNYSIDEYMVLDTATRRNLELTSTIRDNKIKGSLLNIIDKTISSMGGRLIKKWLNQPLIKKDKIILRLDAIEELVDNYICLQEIREHLDGIYDLERILTKVTYGTANAKDLVALRSSLLKLPSLKNSLNKLKANLFKHLKQRFDALQDLSQLLESAIVQEPPLTVREGNMIKKGYDQELDQLRATCQESKDWIANLQKTERERTGINSLKVGFNKVFGYYIEVTKANLDKVPTNYSRKQTLANSERYIIPELKEKEALILGAEEKINDLEYNLFVEIREKVAENIKRIKETASVISTIDVLSSLSTIVIEKNWVKPQIQNNRLIKIENGRHPVVEDMLDEVFVPNDTLLDEDENRFLIITGPNMSGKSTYMRQVAIIVLLAQIGSFVPAKKAKIGLVDRIFTRVGASDDLTTGQSTFMVEMNEVANIVNNASENSLIILDEVGRGTSTYDGLSIAWAVSEYLNEKINAHTLFATHYHELTVLEEEKTGIKNFNVLVEEDEKGVHFLHQIVPGRANDSYGIEVAKLAGLPEEIIKNAQKILINLEAKRSEKNITFNNKITFTKNEEIKEKDKNPLKKEQPKTRKQLTLFPTYNPIVSKLMKAEIVNMTPMEAMNFLYNLQKEAKKEGEEKHG